MSLYHPFDGKPVRICSLSDSAHNDALGLATWSFPESKYCVHTLDGQVLHLPADNLAEMTPSCPEDGGFDRIWPEGKDDHYFAAFACDIVEDIQRKGFCQIQMIVPPTVRQVACEIAQEHSGFIRLKQDFEEDFLGQKGSSKVAWLHKGDKLADALAKHNSQFAALCEYLGPLCSDGLGFESDGECDSSMLRAPFANSKEHQELSPGPICETDIEDGIVELHLDFLQRRALCLLYCVESDGGILEFFPKQDSGYSSTRLPIRRDRLLVFRHDVMDYSYKMQTCDVVLQAWMMSAAPMMEMEFSGDPKRVEALLGGPNIPNSSQVHIMSASCRFPGNANNGLEFHIALAGGGIDGYVSIPQLRFDVDAYLSDERKPGTIASPHCGCVDNDVLLFFDNNYFGLTEQEAACHPPCQRVLLETSTEALIRAGLTKESIRGAPVASMIAEIGLDWDMWHGAQHGEQWLGAASHHSISTANRLVYCLGLTGPSIQIDTACSTSLVTANLGMAYLRNSDNDTKAYLSQGTQNCLQVGPFIGLSAAGMVGAMGRCLTFDQSASGYCRGEGAGGIYANLSDQAQTVEDRIAVHIGGFINQDGRSASLTAPNGPSQQGCIRNSMRDARITSEMVTLTEQHGTGTAIGDPIEVGSVHSVLGRRLSVLPISAVKSHTGHLESTAGSVGIIKCIYLLYHSTVSPNCHLRQLNQNMDTEGFPTLFNTELSSTSQDDGHIGINSFGFGGTNCRADIWGRSQSGPWSTHYKRNNADKIDMITMNCSQCFGPMCWSCGQAASSNGSDFKHKCSSIREKFASYSCCSLCYEGIHRRGYITQDLSELGRKVFLVGSCSAWADFHEMQESAPWTFECTIELGDTLTEKFHLVLDRDRQRAIYPAVDNANFSVRALGPGTPWQNNNWLINGRKDGAPSGTIYRVTFSWSGQQKGVSWTIDPEMSANSQELGHSQGKTFHHTYHVLNSKHQLVPMVPCITDANSWGAHVRMSSTSFEFQVIRDKDSRQVIYPAKDKATSESVGLCGPDENSGTRRWQILGNAFELVTIQLSVNNGLFSLVVCQPSRPAKTWSSSRQS